MKTSFCAVALGIFALSLASCKPEEPATTVLESMKFENTELSLEVGDVIKLEVTVTPADAEGYTFRWESSNEDVASVTDEGEVTAMSAGVADITVSSGEISATCKVTVAAPGIPVESISLDVQQLELGIGETYALQATVLPENATDKSVTWSSSAPEIASVDENGTVEGLAKGYAVITVTTADGGKTAECAVTVAQTINGYEYVDLGLSVKWAACNIGAENPWDYGDYFAWGEIETKDDFNVDNSSTYGVETGDISGDPEHDAAAAIWGGTWRMPAQAEVQELVDECTWTWTSREGINGYEVTGPNDNSIFLPAGGWRTDFSLTNDGKFGYFWCSTPYEADPSWAYILGFLESYWDLDRNLRYFGFSIRPVSD